MDKVHFHRKDQAFSYNNSEYGFSVLYPQDWTFIEGDDKPGDYVTTIVIVEPLGEKGKHFSKKFVYGEVCVYIDITDSLGSNSTLQQFADDVYLNQEPQKSFELLEYETNGQSSLGNKREFELTFESEQGKRDYITKYVGALYPDPDSDASKSLLSFVSKTRDKYSEEMLPLLQVMTDSFRLTENKK